MIFVGGLYLAVSLIIFALAMPMIDPYGDRQLNRFGIVWRASLYAVGWPVWLAFLIAEVLWTD